MSSVFDSFERKHDYLVCVDSDGCAMDTMNCKHFHCFGPMLVDEWGLQQWQDYVLRRWNNISLFQMTRGINRFKCLSMVLSEVNEKYTPIVGVAALERWVETTTALSNDQLAVAIENEEDEDGRICLQKALLWSNAVNESITNLPEELRRPFPGAVEGLALASQFADIAIVSSANRDAIEEEWTKYDMIKFTDILLTQDSGSEEHCIEQMLKFGYKKDHVLMVGDAPGDCSAAEKNGVWFYPILVNWEEESWSQFYNTWLDVFRSGDYGAYQSEKKQVFVENLGG